LQPIEAKTRDAGRGYGGSALDVLVKRMPIKSAATARNGWRHIGFKGVWRVESRELVAGFRA
jgi:hypothetical protein